MSLNASPSSADVDPTHSLLQQLHRALADLPDEYVTKPLLQSLLNLGIQQPLTLDRIRTRGPLAGGITSRNMIRTCNDFLQASNILLKVERTLEGESVILMLVPVQRTCLPAEDVSNQDAECQKLYEAMKTVAFQKDSVVYRVMMALCRKPFGAVMNREEVQSVARCSDAHFCGTITSVVDRVRSLSRVTSIVLRKHYDPTKKITGISLTAKHKTVR